MSRIVLMVKGKADLLLSGVKRDAEGCIIQADVSNGGWLLKVSNGVAYAHDYEYSKPRHEWPAPNWLEIEVPDTVKGDYNEVMCWAEQQKV